MQEMSLLGKKPKDFDLTTDATPEEMIKIAKQGNFKHSTNNINTNLDLGSICNQWTRSNNIQTRCW